MADTDATAGIDYRALLVKYMAHVVDKEGVDFVTEGGWGTPDAIPFTDDERAALERAAADALALYRTL